MNFQGEGKDYYEVLGVSRDADQKAIRDAFRKLALLHHPDRDKTAGAEDRFKAIAEAYAVLSDPAKRSEYDKSGFVAGFSPEDLFGGIDFGGIFDGTGFSGIFDRLFRRRADGNIEVELFVPLERVAKGGEEKVRIARRMGCAICGGSGAEKSHPCASCGGSGQMAKSRKEGDVVIREISTCPACRGRGSIVDKPCAACAGSGETGHDEVVAVSVPRGIEEGMALRVKGKGMPGPPAGDLYVVVRSKPDARFERSGADLWHAESINLTDAVLGTEREVETLDGKARVSIPAGIQPDSVLRLKGKGLPKFGISGKGDLYLKLKVHLPEQLSGEERAIYEKLRSMERHGP